MMKLRGLFKMAVVAIMAALVMTSCVKDLFDTNDSGNDNGNNINTTARYTLTVQPNNADWGIVTGGGNYADGTSVTIEAAPNTGYYFIKWSDGAVSNPRTITVNRNMTLYALFSSNPNDPNPYNPGDNPTPGPGPQPVPDGWVDLGLPSGLLWAECNLGANAPEEYGNYYAWGETTTKEVYFWNTYCYCNVDGDGNLGTLTKYNTNSDYGTIDNLTTLQAADDAATQVLGSGARTPTKEEWEELINNTTVEWTTMNGADGRKFTGSNGNTLFLPAAGDRYGSYINGLGTLGCYWSSSLLESTPSCAWNVDFFSVNLSMICCDRYFGFSIRAVRAPQK